MDLYNNSCLCVLFRSTTVFFLRYLTLEALARLALMPDILATVRHHMPTVSEALRVSGEDSCGVRGWDVALDVL